MASLFNERTGNAEYLRAYHVLGRDSEKADTVLTESKCSRLHAVVWWLDGAWFLKDFSRNGTWVDGERVIANSSIELNHACQIQFGGFDTEIWKLTDIAWPCDLLIEDIEGSGTLTLGKHLLLPDSTGNYAVSYSAEEAGWLMVSADDPDPVGGPYRHGDYISAEDRRWRVFAKDAHISTPVMAENHIQPGDLKVSLHTSLDEESTQALVQYRGKRHDLGFRNQNYLLLHLARIKAAQQNKGVDPVSAGWAPKELLCKELGVSPNNLNLQIHRTQKLVMDSLNLPMSATDMLLEKQRGRLRFGRAACDVYKGAELIAQIPAS